MDGFYGQQYSPQGFQHEAQQDGQEDTMTGMEMPDPGFFTRQDQQLQQQQQQHQHANQDNSPSQSNGNISQDSGSGQDVETSNTPQVSSMMQGANFNNFQFNPLNSMGQSFMMPNFGHLNQQQAQAQFQAQAQAQAQANFNLMSQIMNNQNMYANLMQGTSPVQSSLHPGAQMAMAMNNPMAFQFNPGPDFSDQGVMNALKNSVTPFPMNSQLQMMPNSMMNPMLQNLSHSQNAGQTNRSANSSETPSDPMPSDHVQGQFQSESMTKNMENMQNRNQIIQRTARQQNPLQRSRHNSVSQSRHNSFSALVPDQNQQGSNLAGGTVAQNLGPINGPSNDDISTFDWVTPNNQPRSSGMTIRPNSDSYRNAYSSTGFDMLTVLMRVATRPNPQVNIGAVDLSCAFVVCDTQQHDIPIVYCSENFERLTGYTKHEILGRNCRFLQSPNGHVQAGIKRKYVDDNTVLHLKNTITSRQEAQVSMINYRKGGQPFMNLLTTIPVAYDTDEVKFYVGFQVDLVEQPHSVTNKNSDGTYAINYQRGLTMPRYVFTGQESKAALQDSGQTVPRDEVSTVLTTIGSGESELSKRIWDKILLENSDDVIFVLSLKGLFLYLSPSSKKMLEYDAGELMGAALSSVCHPSDIVPVTRELKDTTNGALVSVVFRIRRKTSGYMWFEAHGALYTEQGKGRKSIVLVGRERPVYTLKKTDVFANGGIGENEVWTKISTSGMFLYVSSSIRSMLDRPPDELLGTSIQALMRADSRREFGRILEIARSGRSAQTRHELVNRRGQVLQAFSVVYPGDAAEGQKPTFLVAQTRLLKYSRSSAAGASKASQQQKQQGVTSQQQLSPQATSPASAVPSRVASATSAAGSVTSPDAFVSTFDTAQTYAGQDSLPLGHQDVALADEQNMFDELKTTRSTSWQYELRQMEKRNRLLAEELQGLLAARKKRKRRKGAGVLEKDCANCHTKTTPEWRRGPSGNRDLCNSCGLRWAKQQGRISPRTNSQRSAHSGHSDKTGGSQPGPQRRKSLPKAGGAGPNSNDIKGEPRGIDETISRSNQQEKNQQQGQKQSMQPTQTSSEPRSAGVSSPRPEGTVLSDTSVSIHSEIEGIE